ncbi:efflux transporter periplasmic adaptor subunit [Desulfobacter hydrogenophilus]|uniref:Efflux RND transporter periplasmic adaptor subunit n=1 Tax=Desulfobacter hydrogenophilus TaxID=2291 RepID=A0A328FIH4_9BACT|nr:efflux RND transporter periplasmic adaptor subunit [Desulfobacter hydrogenophilus]NDY71241.1 efflux RND transporter periplasmic adaptor subunit [Desulfobacter hydrogenophilus]QBH15019.1 efflux RND transporter periplasmic adaptor subunit [Desulfobacter hydrogenophilus]RAM02735.1 efflux transporter periplasmic adaptor subunit [Desulfobacter hydrogenophilus]
MVKAIGKVVIAIVLIGVGYFISLFIPSGGPPPGMMGMGEMPPPAVIAVELKERPLDVLDDHIATVEPVQEVMVRSEVAGYIDDVHFTEGSFVEAGDLLFTIDQKQYQAMVEVREAELARAKAELDRAEKFLKRMREANKRSVSQSDLDTAESDQLQAVANLKQAAANLNLARIDLGYAKVRAPISGRIGMAKVTKGNYVTSASGELARIVQTSPIRVVFSMTDRDYLDFRARELAGTADGLVAHIRLPNGTQLPLVGKKEFDDNVMNSETGTMAVRYLFDNPDGRLVPGGYVNILLGLRQRPMGIRIPQRARLLDPQGSYVLTVNGEGQVGTARIEIGESVEGDFVVLSGLKAGDRIVVDGVQKARPGMTAQVTLQEAGK